MAFVKTGLGQSLGIVGPPKEIKPKPQPQPKPSTQQPQKP